MLIEAKVRKETTAENALLKGLSSLSRYRKGKYLLRFSQKQLLFWYSRYCGNQFHECSPKYLTLSFPYHIEASPLIGRANQWTGFYIIGTSVIKELMRYVLNRKASNLMKTMFKDVR